MLRCRVLLASAATLAAPALVPRASLGQALRKVKWRILATAAAMERALAGG